MALILLGLVLFIIPGLIAAVMFAFAGFILIIEKKSVSQSLQTSYDRARHCFKPLLLVMGLQLLGLIVLYLLFSSGSETETRWSEQMLFAVGNGYLTVFFKIVIFRYYLLQQTDTSSGEQ